MTIKRIRQPSLRQRLKQKKPEILESRMKNMIWEHEVRRKNWAANAQAQHDAYSAEIRNPMPRHAYAVGVENHRARLERMLREAGMFVDPQRSLPEY